MSDLVIETTEIPHIGGTPYAGFAVRAHAALIEEGLSDQNTVMVWPSHSAIVARLATGDPIGILTFLADAPTNTLFLSIAFVVPDFRRRGVFRLMYQELVKAAERREVCAIEAVSVISNAAFNRVAVSSGMRVVAQVYRQDLTVAELTIEQRELLAFLHGRGLNKTTYVIRDEHIIEISVQDIVESKPLAEILHAKMRLYLAGDDEQRDPSRSTER